MNKLIWALIIVVVLFGGWALFQHWEKINSEKAETRQAANAAPAELPGLPYELEQSLSVAQGRGPSALRDWLAAYGSRVHDPRLAAIQLDYVVLVAHESPAEARKVFKTVLHRVHEGSPLYQRVRQLEPTYR